MIRISKEQAIREGLIRYFTGRPCPFGHICERYTSCGKCLDCKRDFRKTPKGKKLANEAIERYRAKKKGNNA